MPRCSRPSRARRSPAPSSCSRSTVFCSSTPARTRFSTYSRSRASRITESMPRRSSARPSVSPAGPAPMMATRVCIPLAILYSPASKCPHFYYLHAMAEVIELREAVASLVRDGDAVALEGFTHLIPFAAGHEVLRQGRSELELIRMTPDVLYDQMVGMGAARKLVFSYAGNPGVGSLHRLRDAVEHGWPRPVEIEEHSHAGMANRYAAGASNLPFALLRGYRGTDLVAHTRVAPVTCPFTGEELMAVPALRP